MKSALYFGTIRHRRFSPRPHRLSYPLFMILVDLDELDTVFRGSWLWSAKRPSLAWIRRRDHSGDYRRPLADELRTLVEKRTGHRPDGAIRLLTHPRVLGLAMNPISFYFCFDSQENLAAVVGEVTNTPWNERHLYVVERANPASRAWTAEFDKDLHVSPFLPMDMSYRWTIVPPTDRLLVHMENHRQGEKVLDATLMLHRREITPRALRSALLRYPLMTWKVLFWIYLHAVQLLWKRIPFHPHPPARGLQP